MKPNTSTQQAFGKSGGSVLRRHISRYGGTGRG